MNSEIDGSSAFMPQLGQLPATGFASLSGPSLGRELVLQSRKIEKAQLEALITGQCMAIRIADFVEPSTANQLANNLLASSEKSTYSNLKSPLWKLGTTLFETHDWNGSKLVLNRERLQCYLDNADRLMKVIEACSETGSSANGLLNGSPLMHLCKIIDSLLGCDQALIEGRPAFAGLVRFTTTGIRPHRDLVREDHPEISWAKEIQLQLAANIYLSVPKQGGKLQLWSRDATSASGKQHEYGISLEQLPPTVELEVRQGELVIFNSEQFHAVTPGDGGERVNISCFFGVRQSDEKWLYWS